MKANFKILTACLVISCMFIAGAYAADNPADTAKSPKPPANITEKLVMDWPKDGKWDGGLAYSGKSTTMELYYPEGQSDASWSEMGSIEIVYNKINANLPGLARSIFLGTQKACPDATWDYIYKSRQTDDHPTVIYFIKCPAFTSGESAQYQIWRLISGKTALFNIQYSFKGDEIPEAQKEKIIEAIKNARIETEVKENP